VSRSGLLRGLGKQALPPPAATHPAWVACSTPKPSQAQACIPPVNSTHLDNFTLTSPNRTSPHPMPTYRRPQASRGDEDSCVPQAGGHSISRVLAEDAAATNTRQRRWQRRSGGWAGGRAGGQGGEGPWSRQLGSLAARTGSQLGSLDAKQSQPFCSHYLPTAAAKRCLPPAHHIP